MSGKTIKKRNIFCLTQVKRKENLLCRKKCYLLLAVIGCADPVPPPGGWMERVGDRVTLRCNSSAISVTLRCNGTKWHGAALRCSRGTLFGASPDSYSVRQGTRFFK